MVHTSHIDIIRKGGHYSINTTCIDVITKVGHYGTAYIDVIHICQMCVIMVYRAHIDITTKVYHYGIYSTHIHHNKGVWYIQHT
jgi:hypothetical protein